MTIKKAIKRTAVLLITILFSILCFSVWIWHSAGKYDDKYRPFVESSIRSITTLNYSEAKELFTKETQSVLETSRGKKALDILIEYGALKEIIEVNFLGASRGASAMDGEDGIVKYSAYCEFIRKKGTVLLEFVSIDNKILIKGFSVFPGKVDQ